MKISAILASATIAGFAYMGAAMAHDHGASDHMEMSAEAGMHAELKEITADTIKEMIDHDKEVVIFDSRKPSEYAQGHIPTAIALRAADATPDRLATLVPNKETPLVFYCGSKACPASGKTAHKAAEAGYKQLYKYTAGIADWKAKGLPVANEN